MFTGLIVALASWFGMWPQAIKPDVVVRGETSIAMIPFLNRSEDAAQDCFSDGISEDVNTDLTNVERLAAIVSS
ncbi:MAG: TolB-like protein [Gammaproteobacteria bacterium]